MFNRLQRSDGFLSPHAWPPAMEEAEAPAPSHSTMGTLFRTLIIRAEEALEPPQTARHPEKGHRDWHGNVVREQAPLYVATGYRDLIGAFIAKPAKIIPVLEAIRYKGQIPMEEQPVANKPDAWSDQLRGLP